MPDPALDNVLRFYQSAFREKTFAEREPASDVLMEVFGIVPSLKAANRQYWGRQLGMCWQRLAVETCRTRCGARFADPERYGEDEPYDFRVDDYVIDTKYRVGSGDAGTLKKFRANGRMLTREGLRPMMLILRSDNLPAAIAACTAGGWDVRIGQAAFAFLKALTGGFELDAWLELRKGQFLLTSASTARRPTG